jgi:hypothetical protein
MLSTRVQHPEEEIKLLLSPSLRQINLSPKIAEGQLKLLTVEKGPSSLL